MDKTNLAQTAFGTVFGESLGAMFVAVCLFFFAFSTILGWNLFGKINVNYLFGKKGVKVYTVIALVFIFLGTVTSNDLVWELTDMFNNLMVIPNAIALFARQAWWSGRSRRETERTVWTSQNKSQTNRSFCSCLFAIRTCKVRILFSPLPGNWKGCAKTSYASAFACVLSALHCA